MNSSIKLLLGLMAAVPALHATSVKLGDTSGTSGTDSVDIQSVRTFTSMVAGDYAVAIGTDNTAAHYTIAIGVYNTTAGFGSAFGLANDVSTGIAADFEQPAWAFGAFNEVDGDKSFVCGLYNAVSASYAYAFGGGITNGTSSSLMIGPNNGAKVTILSSGYVGIGFGNTSPSVMLDVNGTVKATGDVEVADSGDGLILKSPNGTRFRITISNSGVLSAASL